MAVEFRCATARGRGYARELRADAEHLLRAAGVPDCELSLMLVSDRAMRALNRDFRGIDAPTDVLSFSQIEEAGAAPPSPRALINRKGLPLGDVVISLETAGRHAKAQKHSLRREVEWLLLHGTLHLLGYDDADEYGLQQMIDRQQAVLRETPD